MQFGHLVVLSVAMICASLAPTRAQAQGDEQARQLYIQGDRYYQEGRYEEAVQAFQESYRMSGRPLLLFNLANAYERLGRYGEALEALRGYQPHAAPNEQQQISIRITHLEQRAAEGGGGPATYDETLVGVGAAIGALGVLMVIGGGVSGALALDARETALANCAMLGETRYCDSGASGALADDELFSLLADVGIGVGGAAVVAGVVLLIVGATSGPASQEYAVLPYFVPRPGGGEVGATFAF